MSVVSCIINLSKEMENEMPKSNINASGQVLANLRESGKSYDIVSAYAFGLAWAYLTEQTRDEVIKASERILKESKDK